MARLLGRGREEGAERDIIGARLARLHREVAAVVAGDADLRRRAEQRARLARIAVLLPEMDAVGAEPLGEAHIVVDDEGDLARRADRLQRLGEARRLVLVDALHPELEGGDRPRVERRRERVGKGAADVERRDQIELAGGPGAGRARTARRNRMRKSVSNASTHARASTSRPIAAVKPAGSSSRWAMAVRLFRSGEPADREVRA